LGALTGLCSFPRKEAELNAPAMKPKQKNQHIIPATKKRNKADAVTEEAKILRW